MRVEFLDLLRTDLVLQISGTGELKVKEFDKGALLKELIIGRLPSDAIAFELDHKPSSGLKKSLGKSIAQLSWLLRPDHPKINKKCDFVIVSPGDPKTTIVLGDLKSTSPKKSDCSAQLKNSELFVSFLLSLLSEHHSIRVEAEYKRVVFFVAPGTVAKAPTQQKIRQTGTEDSGVVYFPVTVAGRNNGTARVSFPDIV